MKLEKDTYLTVKKMLESSDKENMVLAFECIENTNFEENMIYILLLLRETNIDNLAWIDNAPKTVANLEKNVYHDSLSNATTDFRKLGTILREHKASEEDYQFFMIRYADFLKNTFNQDEDIIEDIIITIKLKNNEK